MKQLKEYSAIVNDAVAGLRYGKPSTMYDPIEYTLAGGGKRIRPVLALAAADAYGADLAKVVTPAVGIEIYHNFTLLHDDIMDNSPTRRGRKSVWAKWDVAQAILSGDAMLSLAMEMMTSNGFSDAQRIALMRNFNTTAIAVDRGQQLDIDFEKAAQVTPDEYIEMISLKTGALLAGACITGAICGNASETALKAFYDYGINLGIAFQIQDDILDVYSDETTLGKPIGGDILNDKHTWLLIHAQDAAPAEVAAIYDAALTGREKIDAMREIYDRHGIRALSEAAVAHYTELAISALGSAGLSCDAVGWFARFAHSLINRTK